MIIVEGCDGTGKSTLVQALRRDLELPVAPKVVDSQTRALVDLRAWVDDNLAAGFQATIFDRHRLISEPIYGTVLPTKKITDFWHYEWLRRSMSRFETIRPLVIYCRPPFSVVWENLSGDEHNDVIRPYALRLYNAYTVQMVRHVGSFHYDYTSDDERQTTYQRILRTARDRLDKEIEEWSTHPHTIRSI